jgi:curved DNA-binding protein CbpA
MNRCPYEVLGVERGADESTVRRRYLELVRSFPPEREPVRFAEIRRAYDRLRDPVARLQQQLFEDGSGESIDVIVAELRDGVRRRPIPTELLLSLGELR